MNYGEFFKAAMHETEPLPYQERLACADPLPSLLDVPTGLGKTAAAILAWVWRRRFAEEAIRSKTPRRLVYCLPMRVLVEQTHTEAVKWLERLDFLAGSANWTELGPDGLPTKSAQLKPANGRRGYEANPDASRPEGWASKNGDRGTHPIAVHLLLGGEERSDWVLWPERDAILIGTQDMLISRALNRGYAAGRARWPQEFGLLNSDCLWVFDEIQIMDTSLATSLQLDAWRRRLRLRPSRDAFPTETADHLGRPCHSLWMSATMAKHWLERAVDWSECVDPAWKSRHELSDVERTDGELRSGKLFEIRKELVAPRHVLPEDRRDSGHPILALEKPKTKDNRADKVDAQRKQADYLKRLAEHIAKTENHAALGLTLVIVNTVDRATKLFELLRQQSGFDDESVKLIHSRFRPYEREEWSGFLSRKDETKRVLISTQVVEAGVDLSAAVLYTELAPWASLVQRFGRCARYPSETGQVFWLDLDLGNDTSPVEHWAKPYDRTELAAARKRLESLDDVGIKSLNAVKEEMKSNDQRSRQELVGNAVLPSTVQVEAINLQGITGRAIEVQADSGGSWKLTITGEWSDVARQKLLEQNPEKLKVEDTEKSDNPAHSVVREALDKWKKAKEEREQARKWLNDFFPYAPRFVPRDKDLFDLFDTTPDLTGADVDVSRFIRDGEELDVQVFWRDPKQDPFFSKEESKDPKRPLNRLRPQRRELCPVPFHRFRDELLGLRKEGRIWRKNFRKGWELIDLRNDELVYPGQVFLLEAACGGYSKELGWTGNPQDDVELEQVEDIDNKTDASTDTDDSEDLSELSGWLSIEEHCRDVGRKMAELLKDAGLSDSERKILLIAARLHDWGKAHQAFIAKLKQEELTAARGLAGQPAAKAPRNAWRRDEILPQSSATSEADKDRRRPGHRHELASALAILETLCSAQPTHEAFAWPEGLEKASFGEATDHTSATISAEHPLVRELAELSTDELDLLVYLVASHHGKVRMSLRSSPDDEREDVPDPCPTGKHQARGVRDGDVLASCRLPAANLDEPAAIEAPTVTLSLDPMGLGLSPRYGASWRERTQLLLERLGPFRLGYLEALLRAADCLASREEDERGRRTPQ